MASEITLNVSMRFVKGGTDIMPAFAQALARNVAGNNWIWNRQTIGTSEEAILLGDAGAGGYFIAINRDATNFLSLRQASAAGNFVQLIAGDVCAFRLSPNATAPFAIADTGACELEYVLIEL